MHNITSSQGIVNHCYITLLDVSVMMEEGRRMNIIIIEWSTRPYVGTRETTNVKKIANPELHDVVKSNKRKFSHRN